ncbi:MAG: polyhydroxyalkanoic acid system family protein [Bdellovibrionales bacterium]|nr:polyhydroxyalkanoic acid system family protein [Bdellovibrionales bacterium]
MPSYKKDVKIPGKSADEIYEKIQGGIERFLSKTPIGKFDLSKDAKNRAVEVKSAMFNGTLSAREGVMVVEAQLSFLAAPFKGKLDEGIEKWVSKTFGA